MVQTYPARRHRRLSVRSFAMSTVYDLSFAQLAERLGTWGEPAFRAKQVWSQLWKRAATYDAMSDVAPALRERLAAELPLGVEVLDERTADRGADTEGVAQARRHARDRSRPDGISRSGHGLRVVAGRVRDGLHVLRHRSDGTEEQPDRG